jgi:hypothetical protein
MNVTDIFINNGQLNWDAINTISNIVLVAALVIVTCLYARQVRKQTILMEKDMMRNKILEEIQDVLTPTIYSLEKEIEAIKTNEIFWYKSREEGLFEGLFKIYGNNGAFKDVFEKIPDLEEVFLSHDNLYSKLNGLYTEIEREIRTHDLEKSIENHITEFNKLKEEGKLMDSERVKTIVNCVINKWNPKRRPHTTELYIDFWDKYSDKLLEFRDTRRVKQLDKAIGDQLNLMKDLDSKILDKIKEKREEYRKEYSFTKYEIDPQLKETITNLSPNESVH